MIRTVLQLFIILSFLHLRSEAGSCYIYSKNSQRRCTGWFGWDCSYYYYSTKACCYDYEGTTCSNPKCRYGYGSHTCNKDDEGYVKYPNGNVIKNSGGECYEPSKCRNCNKGYYPVTFRNGYCKACYKPSHCNVPVCLSSSNYWCEYCEGEYNRMKPGYNVYTGHPDNRKCQRACSWRYGARCFPGTCTGHMILDKECKCAKGFTSVGDCSKATTAPDIKQMYFILHQSSKEDNIYVNKALQKRIFWTKETEWSSISLRATSNYKAEIDSLNKPNYITGYYIGVQELKMVLTLSRGLKLEEWTIDGGCTNFDETCDKKITDNVLSSISPWRQILNFRYFQHGDKIKFKVSATNGGKILYEDRGKTGRPYREGQYFLNGMTVNEALELRFDSLQPTHCFEQDYDCGKDPLTATDFLTKPKLEVSWDGWSDSDSGIDKYELNIYYLENSLHNNLLEHKYKLSGMSYSSSKCSATLKLEAPGPYSVELSVHDHAKNYKVARRIILYDNASVVDLYGQPARIVQAKETGWINKLSNHIEIKWQDRFRNIRHSDGGWLNGVRKIEEISRILDDQEGRSNRTVDRLYNIDGIVRFDIARKVDYNGVSKHIGFEPVPQIFFKLERMVYYDEEFVDGKRLKFYIRGVDALGKYAEDTVTAMIDLSPPIIQNFRLSQSIRNSINNINKKYQFKVEWEAFDFDSGINNVSWKIFDNFTKPEIVHRQSYESPQGETETKDECISGYSLYARGAKCYCSPYNGCFHRHFLVKPKVSFGNISQTETGKHNSGYFMELTIINNAGLTTIRQREITL